MPETCTGFVDFLIADERKPLLLVETKLSGTSPPENLVRFQDTLGAPAVQLVNSGESFQLIRNRRQKILIAPAYMWLSVLP